MSEYVSPRNTSPNGQRERERERERMSSEKIELMDVDDVEEEKVDDGENKGRVVERVTTRYMTKYERARVLGTRALQIR